VRIRVETSSAAHLAADRRQIRAQCASGPQTRRPAPFRPALAAELAVNQNTILHVYERLAAEGLLQRRHGDGTFVADASPPAR